MRRALTLLVLTGALLATSAIVAGGPVRRKPGGEDATPKFRFVVGEHRGYPSVSLSPTENAPDGVTVPEGFEDCVFQRRDLGPGHQLLLAAHLKTEPIWIRVDRDFDGKLEGEEPIHLTGTTTTLTAIVKVEIPLTSTSAPQEIPLRFIHHHNPGSTCLHLTVPVHREGEVVLAGRLRRVLSLDGDGDLLFDGETGDGLYLDVDGDTEITRTNPSGEKILPGRTFVMGGHAYRAEVTKSGQVRFQEMEEVPPSRLEDRPWPRGGVPSRGAKAPGATKSLGDLRRDYEAAEKKDGGAGSNRTTERTRVIREIGQEGSKGAYAFLKNLYRSDPNVNIKSQAIRALGYVEYQPFAGDIADIARGSDHSAVRMAANAALHGMDAPGREAVYLEVLRDTNDESLFGDAARHLAYLKSEAGIAELTKLAAAHGRDGFRYRAYDVVTRYRNDAPPPALVLSAAGSEDPRLRALGLEHAFRLGLPETRALALASIGSTDEGVMAQAIRILATSSDPEAVGPLLTPAATAPADLRRKAVDLLRPIRRADTVELLAERLGAGAIATRVLIAEVLAGIPMAPATEALLQRLEKEKDPRILAALIRALGAHRPEGVESKIVKAADKARANPETLAAALDALAAFGLENREVRRFFEKAASSRDFAVRVVTLDAAAKAGGEVAADLLLAGLDDEAWQVRLTAVQGLGKVRVRRAVVPLIELLSTEELPRIRSAIADTLFVTTGRNFYDIEELWHKWWEEHGEDFEVPEKIPEIKPDDHARGSVASFYGVPVETDRLIFVIDQSGSMSSASGSKTKLEVAVEQTIEVIGTLGKNARFNVIFFETAIHPWQKQLVKVGPQTRAAAKKHLESKRPTGGTNLYDGLEIALLTKGVDTIYLLSDGAPGSGKFVKHEDILREVEKINRTRKIAIHCVAVGFDSPLMKDLAAQNGGQYVRR
jgi:HEAT repeat protein